ncbi:hypothetical protein B0H11DRAFT_1920428 [Mycena galericulata]|nr:hypothetical protein B0H11DRAFT_1920428 [Mycena galericulata]
MIHRILLAHVLVPFGSGGPFLWAQDWKRCAVSKRYQQTIPKKNEGVPLDILRWFTICANTFNGSPAWTVTRTVVNRRQETSQDAGPTPSTNLPHPDATVPHGRVLGTIRDKWKSEWMRAIVKKQSLVKLNRMCNSYIRTTGGRDHIFSHKEMASTITAGGRRRDLGNEGETKSTSTNGAFRNDALD